MIISNSVKTEIPMFSPVSRIMLVEQLEADDGVDVDDDAYQHQNVTDVGYRFNQHGDDQGRSSMVEINRRTRNSRPSRAIMAKAPVAGTSEVGLRREVRPYSRAFAAARVKPRGMM